MVQCSGCPEISTSVGQGTRRSRNLITRDPDLLPPTQDTIRWVLASVGPDSVVSTVRTLTGGRWHANHAVDIVDRDGRLHRLVLRRWARPGWEADDPDLTAAREAEVLELLWDTPVPAPRLVAADPDGTHADAPALLLARLPGRPRSSVDTDADLEQLAATLLVIHSVEGDAFRQIPAYRRYFEAPVLPPSLEASAPWRQAGDIVRTPAPGGAECFIHRDYHPGNCLWSESRLTGVVDWTQASWGSPSVDLGHMRWNLAAAHGPEVAHRFLEAYLRRAGAGFEHHPYWDVVTLVDLMAEPDAASSISAAELARLERYLVGLLADLEGIERR